VSRRAPSGPPATEQGVVYTLHLDPPLGHARHYTGFGKDLEARLAEHERGQGARLTQVQLERGGTWRLASAEPGTRDREAQLKERGASRRCQICREEARADGPEPEPEAEAGR
jgi:predicted GIY-YIG superfamily endonuclease